MKVIIDTSVWIDYFNSNNTSPIDEMIENNLLAVNHIILSELVPFLEVKRQKKLISILYQITLFPLAIDWTGIIQMQVKCLQAGANGIGIPDLIIAQNALQNNTHVLSQDKHFSLISKVLNTTIHVEN